MKVREFFKFTKWKGVFWHYLYIVTVILFIIAYEVEEFLIPALILALICILRMIFIINKIKRKK